MLLRSLNHVRFSVFCDLAIYSTPSTLRLSQQVCSLTPFPRICVYHNCKCANAHRVTPFYSRLFVRSQLDLTRARVLKPRTFESWSARVFRFLSLRWIFPSCRMKSSFFRVVYFWGSAFIKYPVNIPSVLFPCTLMCIDAETRNLLYPLFT